tara:strand:- start:2117 stop:2776 length:660 start_codon:yes stop_codon:yes gene_type:complete
MAWDFAAEIHALSGFDADDTSTTSSSGETLSTHATQWLTDGAKEVVNLSSNSSKYKSIISTTNTLNTSSPTLTLNDGNVSNVVFYDGTRLQSCRMIPANMKGRVNDVNDLMNFATSSDPVCWINAGVLEIFPTPTDSNYGKADTLNYPTVTYSDSSISSFPNELEKMVVLYASIKATEYMMLTEEDQEVYGPQLQTLKQDYKEQIAMLMGPSVAEKERG